MATGTEIFPASIGIAGLVFRGSEGFVGCNAGGLTRVIADRAGARDVRVATGRDRV